MKCSKCQKEIRLVAGHWACLACGINYGTKGPAWMAGNEQAWKDLQADGGLPEAHEEEMVPHPFRSRTPYEPSDDRDIWCMDCEYHRDHSVHTQERGL